MTSSRKCFPSLVSRVLNSLGFAFVSLAFTLVSCWSHPFFSTSYCYGVLGLHLSLLHPLVVPSDLVFFICPVTQLYTFSQPLPQLWTSLSRELTRLPSLSLLVCLIDVIVLFSHSNPSPPPNSVHPWSSPSQMMIIPLFQVV